MGLQDSEREEDWLRLDEGQSGLGSAGKGGSRIWVSLPCC